MLDMAVRTITDRWSQPKWQSPHRADDALRQKAAMAVYRVDGLDQKE
jgi:hypothetical protein